MRDLFSEILRKKFSEDRTFIFFLQLELNTPLCLENHLLMHSQD